MLELACSRCLDAYAVPVDARFDLLYSTGGRIAGGGRRVEVREEDINTAFYKEGVIDLAGCYRAALSDAPDEATVPRQLPGPLPGVRCELERHDVCSCETRWEDPRFASLKALLKESDDA